MAGLLKLCWINQNKQKWKVNWYKADPYFWIQRSTILSTVQHLAEHDLFTVSLEKPIAALRKQDPKYAAVYTIVFSAKNVTHLSTVKKQNVKLTKQQNKEEQARGGSVTY